MTNERTKVAGVTFNNEETDDNRNRQEILKELLTTYGAIITVDLKQTVYANPKTGKNEPAIKCVEHRTKQVIGWIPRTMINNLINVKQMTGFISYAHKTYSVALAEQKAPTRAQYHYMKDICKKNNYQMPAYDVRAYGAIFAQVKNKKNKK